MRKTSVRQRLTATSAALAIGAAALIAGASAPAGAASVSTWDKVAECESSGNWSIVSANGLYYGGLQFTLSTWRAYGGSAYNAYPNKATKKQQILIGEKVLAGQGEDAWKVCGPRAGLARDHADPYPSDPPPTTPPDGSVLSWYLADSAGVSEATRPMFKYGNTPMVPLSGDFDGSGSDEAATYDPRTST
ncbi:transglycosylase family protein, partial [Streptomyces sp. SID3343]|uniref:transglycosylase family protein n=1 Tax=Streptomyces sp. SID3343 TaxID=2690260 RepID=UPI00136AD78F